MENNIREKAKIKQILLSVAGLIVFFGLWQFAVKTELISSRSLSAPSDVLNTFFMKLTSINPDGATLITHFLMSFKLAITGFAVAIIIGIPLGLLMGYFKAFDLYATPIFEIIRPIPPIAWIPIVILTLGIDMRAKVFIIFVAAFVPCVINSYLGVKLTDQTLINVSKTFGASNWQTFTKICIPSSMSMVFAGVRISLNSSWSTLVAAEMLASTQGLGYMIQMGRQLIRPDIIIVGMLTIGGTGALLSWLLGLLEKRVAPWRYK